MKAALQDMPQAQYSLGLAYENGQGVQQDILKALYWYEKAEQQDFALARERIQKVVVTKRNTLRKKPRPLQRILAKWFKSLG